MEQILSGGVREDIRGRELVLKRWRRSLWGRGSGGSGFMVDGAGGFFGLGACLWIVDGRKRWKEGGGGSFFFSGYVDVGTFWWFCGLSACEIVFSNALAEY